MRNKRLFVRPSVCRQNYGKKENVYLRKEVTRYSSREEFHSTYASAEPWVEQLMERE